MTEETIDPALPLVGALPFVGALLRRPAVFVRHEVLTSLRAAGFDDILPAHLGVFQHPGPDGQQPGVLAKRTHASKQAMNHLLHQLETSGYLTRARSATDSLDNRGRIVRLTERGRSAQDTIGRTMSRLDKDWQQALGPETYRNLAQALEELNNVTEAATSPSAKHTPQHAAAEASTLLETS
jgi:DNA-binding MarR family transcriptional regulator